MKSTAKLATGRNGVPTATASPVVPVSFRPTVYRKYLSIPSKKLDILCMPIQSSGTYESFFNNSQGVKDTKLGKMKIHSIKSVVLRSCRGKPN